jgi:hypothetical protein
MSKGDHLYIPAHVQTAIFKSVVSIIEELEEHQTRVGKLTDTILKDLDLLGIAPPQRKPS